jgi:hypothetical protein
MYISIFLIKPRSKRKIKERKKKIGVKLHMIKEI